MDPPKQEQVEQESRAYEQMKFKLGDNGMALLEGQLQTWTELNDRELESPLRESLAQGDIRIPRGTLLHGTGMHELSIESIKGIAEHGILSGELIGITEDSETHGCADFFRTPEDTTITEYFAWAREPVVSGKLRRQRGEKLLTSGVTFIVDAQAEGMDRLLQRDGYSDGEMADFVHPPSGRNAEDTAAILGGVPRGAIAGLVVSSRLLKNSDVLAMLRESFPDLPIFNQDGVVQ